MQHDGRISSHEFIDGLETLKVELSEARIKQIIAFLDSNLVGRVDYEEFILLFGGSTLEDQAPILLQLAGIFRKHGVDLNQTFESLDRYGEGSVLVHELCE